MTNETTATAKSLGGVEAFTEAWKLLTTKTNELMSLIVLLGVSLITVVVSTAANSVLIEFLISILQLMITFVAFKGFLQVVRGEKVGDLATMFQQYKEILKMFLTSLVVALISFFGFFFFIIPGIYLALKYGFAVTFTIDEGLGVEESMARSSAVTKGRKFELLGFCIIAFIINVIGAIPAGLGLFVTIPLTMLASIILYENWK